MSSLAQEESRSISENITWGKRKQFADGKVSLPYKQFLGYRKGANGLPEIVPEEAEVVRLIYRMFIEGKTPCYIAKHLTEKASPHRAKRKLGKSAPWRAFLQTKNTKVMLAFKSVLRPITLPKR
jgi:DNA invertase Pin-like site-specific DNA recombinase